MRADALLIKIERIGFNMTDLIISEWLCECGCGKRKPSLRHRYARGHSPKKKGRSLQERFWEKVDKTTTPDGCWLWDGAKFGNGYGHIFVDGKHCLAHRIAWSMESGPIPEGLIILHECDVKNCVRASHLRLGTYRDNSLDMVAKGRNDQRKGKDSPSFGRLREFCNKGHKLTADNVVFTNKGKSRRCIICHRKSSRAGANRYIARHRESINELKRRRRAAVLNHEKLGSASHE